MKYVGIEAKIPNTIMRILVNNEGKAVCIMVTPCEGYETHHVARCWEDVNLETGEKTFVHGFSTAPCTVPLDYDFDNTKEIDGHIAYGEKEIFAREVTTNV